MRLLIIGLIAFAVVALAMTGFLLFRKPTTRSGDTSTTDEPPPAKGDDAPAKAALDRARKELAEAEKLLRTPGARWTALVERADRCASIAGGALREHPDVAELHLARGRALALADKREAAELALGRASGLSAAQLELALLALDSSEMRAAERFTRCAETSKDEQEARFARGFVALLEGRTREAMDTATALLRIEPRPDYSWLRARARDKALESAGALADYQEALKLVPNRRVFVVNAADLLRRMQRAKDAEPLLRSYLEFRPDDDGVLALLARMRAAQRDPSAIELATQAINANPQKLERYRDRAYVYHVLAHHREAIDDATVFLEKRPRDAEALAIRGLSRFSVGELSDAETDLLAAVRADSEQGPCHLGLAQIADRTGRSDEALRHLNDALRCSTATWVVLLEVGRLFAKYGVHDNAVAALDRAAQLNPNSKDVALERMTAYIDTRQYDKAEAEARRHGKLIGSDPAMLINLGLIAAKRGRLEESVDYCSRAIALDDKLAVAYHNRGSAYFDMKRWREAVADWKRAIELDPGMEQTLRDSLSKAEQNLRGQ